MTWDEIAKKLKDRSRMCCKEDSKQFNDGEEESSAAVAETRKKPDEVMEGSDGHCREQEF